MELNGTDRCLGCMRDKAGAERCPHCGWDARQGTNPPGCLAPGTRLHDQYVLGRVLGRGGFGVTYLAWDLRLDTRVAIKEYLPRDCATRSGESAPVSRLDVDGNDTFAWGLARFIEEARLLARFAEHPGIVTVLNSFEANDTAYMVMQYVEGEDLKSYLHRAGRLPAAAAFGLLGHVLDALRAIHDGGLLHRDIAPDNIFLTSAGRVILLDFGTAREAFGSHTRSMALVHKPGFSPEEQYRANGQQGPWTDLYAAAATWYCMLTGQAPPEALERLAGDTLEPPSRLGVALEPHHEAALLKALAVRAAERFQDVRAWQAALHQTPPPPVPAPPPPPRRVAWLIPALLVLVALLAGGLVVALVLAPRPDAPALAEQARQAALEQARREVEAQRQAEAAAQAQRDAEAGRQRAAEEEQRALEARVRREVEEQLRQKADEQARQEAEARLRREVEEQLRRDAADQARRAIEEQTRREAEEKARQAAAEQAQRDALQNAANAAGAAVLAYYGHLSAQRTEEALGAWASVKDPTSLRGLIAAIARAQASITGPINFADPNLDAAAVPVRTVVTSRQGQTQCYAGNVQMVLIAGAWKIKTLKDLTAVPCE